MEKLEITNLKRWRDVGDGPISYTAGSKQFADDVIVALAELTDLQATISRLTASWDDLEAELAAMHAHLGRAADKHRTENPNDHAGFDAKVAKQRGLGKAIQMVQNRRAALATPLDTDAERASERGSK